jgi:anti-sigma B factor antagonist
MNSLQITERRYKTLIIMDLAGNIRLGEGNIIFRKALKIIVEDDNKNILVNLANVNYIDSSGLGELVAGYVSLEKVGGRLKLLNLNDRVRNIMVMTKLLTIFEVFENEDDAVASFQTHSENSEIKQSAIATGELETSSTNL